MRNISPSVAYLKEFASYRKIRNGNQRKKRSSRDACKRFDSYAFTEILANKKSVKCHSIR
jgi:hypothetical protein